MTASGHADAPRGGKVAAIAAAALAGCWLDAVIPSWRLSPDLGHAWAAPLLIAFLYWERWHQRPPLGGMVSADRTGPGLRAWGALAAVLIAALPVRLLLSPYPLWPAALLVYTAIVVALAAAAAWLAGGRAALQWLLPPLALMLACLPVPSAAENGVLLPLRAALATGAAEVSNVLGHPALAAGTTIRVANGWIGVEEACSGIRSLQAALLFALFFGEWFRFRVARRAALIAVAIAAAIAGNFGRVLFLTLYSAAHGTIEAVHDQAGWIAMITSLAATTIVAAHWAGYKLPSTGGRSTRPAVVNPSRGWLAVAAVGLLAITAATHLWFSTAVRNEMPAQWTARLPVEHWSFQPEPLSESAREMLRPDRFVAGRWRDSSNREVESYFVEWTRGQVARSVPFLHNPTVCLPYAGCELRATLAPIDVASAAGPVTFFVFRFQRAGQPLLVAFTIWDPSRGQLLERPEEYRNWWSWLRRQWRDVREHRRDQPAQLLAVSVAGDEGARSALEGLLRMLVVSPSVGVRQGT